MRQALLGALHRHIDIVCAAGSRGKRTCASRPEIDSRHRQREETTRDAGTLACAGALPSRSAVLNQIGPQAGVSAPGRPRLQSHSGFRLPGAP